MADCDKLTDAKRRAEEMQNRAERQRAELEETINATRPGAKTEEPEIQSASRSPGITTETLKDDFGEFSVTKINMSELKRIGNTTEERGEWVINKIMEPIVNAKVGNEIEGVTGDAKKAWAYSRELDKYYTSADNGMPMTNYLIAMQDSEVRRYIGSLTPDEHARIRQKIANTLGGKNAGDAAMIEEKAWKEENLKKLEQQFRELGQWDELAEDARIMFSEGGLSRNDLVTITVWRDAATKGGFPDILKPMGEMSEAEFRTAKAKAEIMGLNDKARRMQGEWDLQKTTRVQKAIENYDYSKLTKETAKGEYDTLSREIGKEGADEIIRTKTFDDATKLTTELKKKGKLDKVLGTTTTDGENKLINDILNGKTVTPSDLRSIQNIAAKVSPEGWDHINALRRTMEGLDPGDQARIMQGMQKSGSWSKTKKLAALGGTLIGLFGIALPGIIIWSPGQVTNVAEMSDLFKQFSEDKSPSGLMRHFFNNEKITIGGKTFSPMDITTNFLNGLNEYEDQLAFWYGIPLYGDYIKALTMFGPNHTADSIRNNYAKIYSDMADMGLIIPDDSIIGFRAATDIELVAKYAEDPSALFKTADSEWINKYGEKLYGKDGFSASEVPDGQQMTSTQIMAYYHMLKGDGVVPYNAQGVLGLDERTKGWQQNQPDFARKVLEYGDEKEQSLQRKTTSDIARTSTQETTDLYELAVSNAMKRDGLSRESAIKSVDFEIEQLEARGDDRTTALEKLTGKIQSSSARAGEDISISGSDSELPDRPEDQYANKVLEEKGFKKSSQSEKQAQIVANTRKDGDLDFKAMKDKDESLKPKDVEYLAGKGFIEPYVKENIGTMTKDDIKDAQEVDKKATANAILDSVSDDCAEG